MRNLIYKKNQLIEILWKHSLSRKWIILENNSNNLHNKKQKLSIITIVIGLKDKNIWLEYPWCLRKEKKTVNKL